MTDDSLSRRQFVAASGALGLSLAAGACAVRVAHSSSAPEAGAGAGASRPPRDPSALPMNATILFQGDSITDAGRNRAQQANPNVASSLGTGYPLLVAAALLEQYPDRGLAVFNRGISGHKVPDLQARWETDTIAIRPDLLSILIGVNDFWHTLSGRYSGTRADYERQYAELLATTKRALPQTRIVVLEPFVTRVGVVNEKWFPEFDERRAAAARVARDAGATWVPLQAMLDALSQRAGPAHWAADGVHPTPAGHAAIADRWREVVKV